MSKCIICDNKSENNYLQCKSCNKITQEYLYFHKEKNNTIINNRNHYQMLKDSAEKQTNEEKFNVSCCALIAIALDSNKKGDTSLIKKVEDDISELKQKKRETKSYKKKCIICKIEHNEKTNLCRNCKNEAQKRIEEIKKIKKTIDLHQNIEHYETLKKNLTTKILTQEELKYNCITLIALAEINKTEKNDSTLIKKVYSDVKTILEKIDNPYKKEYYQCVLCGSNNNNSQPLCKQCYISQMNKQEEIEKDFINLKENQSFYLNLYKISKTKILNKKTKKEIMQVLISVAKVNEKNNDKTLINRVYQDIKETIGNPTPEIAETQIHNKQSQDGHVMDSDLEITIDDILYTSQILHCCHKQVDEIIEENLFCDWFIPIKNEKGIYIEYWGMNTDEYLQRKSKKIKLYKKYNLPLIEIQKDEPKHDTQNFKSRLKKEIKKKAIEYFGEMPEWS